MAAIEENVTRYKSLICRCIREPMVVSYLSTVLTPDDSNTVKRIFVDNQDQDRGVEELIKLIQRSKNKGKWEAFVTAIRKAEYTYLADILENKLHTRHGEYERRMIQIFSPELEKHLQVGDVITELYSYGIITEIDKQQVLATLEQKGNTYATMVLLDRMQCRKSPGEWYRRFLRVLRRNGHHELVKAIEPDLPKSLPMDISGEEMFPEGGNSGGACGTTQEHFLEYRKGPPSKENLNQALPPRTSESETESISGVKRPTNKTSDKPYRDVMLQRPASGRKRIPNGSCDTTQEHVLEYHGEPASFKNQNQALPHNDRMTGLEALTSGLKLNSNKTSDKPHRDIASQRPASGKQSRSQQNKTIPQHRNTQQSSPIVEKSDSQQIGGIPPRVASASAPGGRVNVVSGQTGKKYFKECLCEKSGICVEVDNYKGEMRIDIRRWIHGNSKATKEGISLKVPQWASFVESMPHIDRALRKGEGSQCHLGDNVFYMIEKGDFHIDLQKHEKTTRKGIRLGVDEYMRLKELEPKVRETLVSNGE